jgi:hypothetical protein
MAEIEARQKRIEELKREISEEENKIEATINRVWGEEIASSVPTDKSEELS